MISLFEKKFLQFIQKEALVKKNDNILIALSGGSDSVAMLHLLLAVSPILKIRLGLVHCNFSLRKTSKRDELFCKSLANSLNIEYFVKSFNTKHLSKKMRMSIEETARILRYSFFEDVVKNHGYNKVATAHHANDNAETILFNLLRGTTLSGLTGIPQKRGIIIRPLIHFQKEELVSYLSEKKITFMEDETNIMLDHDRNFLRHNVLPLINQRFSPKGAKSLVRFSESVQEILDFVHQEVESKKSIVLDNKHYIIVKAMKNLHPFIQKEIFKNILLDYKLPVNTSNLNRLVELVHLSNGKTVSLSKDWFALRENDKILLHKKH